ncbi:tartrate dehydrogenase, partial [mine drainage metagenome]
MKIRQSFQQYVNLRPVKLLPGAPSPLAGRSPQDIDMVVLRENTEGEYAGIGGFLFPGDPEREVALQTAVYSRVGVERIVRHAFDLGRRLKKSVTSVSKGNACNYSGVFWDKVFREVAEEYPDVPTRSYLVDAASMFFVRDPSRFGVVVTGNLYGDILTDLGAAITGGMGLA